LPPPRLSYSLMVIDLGRSGRSADNLIEAVGDLAEHSGDQAGRPSGARFGL